MSEENNEAPEVRDLWAEVDAKKIKKNREDVERWGENIYKAILVIGFLVSVALYTRPTQWVIQLFGVFAAIILTVSDIKWLSAARHGAHGRQRNIAFLFWALGFVIYGLNVAALYYSEMKVPMGDLIERWYYNASMLTVVSTALGWALFVMSSISQRSVDAYTKAEGKALELWEHGIANPDAETKRAANQHLNQSYSQFIKDIARAVGSSYGGLKGNTSAANAPSQTEREKGILDRLQTWIAEHAPQNGKGNPPPDKVLSTEVAETEVPK